MLEIVYEDENVLVVNKAAGRYTQSARPQDKDLVSEVLLYRRRKGETPYAALINRLDQPVSGLVLFAKTKGMAASLNRQMKDGKFCKQYYALVCGKPEPVHGKYVDYLIKDSRRNQSCTADKTVPGSRRAELEYEVLKTKQVNGQAVSLVKIHLLTGRHHQIRVQFSSRGLPLLGDVQYGGEPAEKSRCLQDSAVLKRGEIALCAFELTLSGRTFSVRPDWLPED